MNGPRFVRFLLPLLLSALPSTGAEPAAASRPSPTLHAPSRTSVLIELTDPPAAVVYAEAVQRKGVSAAAAETRPHVTRLRELQNAVASALPAGTAILYSLESVCNGIAAEVDSDAIDRIAALPGIRAVHPLPQHERELNTSVPLAGVPIVWSGLGLRGDGVRVGIIDTGVDYLHRTFGGSGVYAGQSYTDANVPWTAKVAGGTDLVGDAYDSGSTDPEVRVPHPDPDPMDCQGHGTHVASVAAGYGVTADGQTFTGPFDASTSSLGLRIAPGVAPGAVLYAIRVFGCTGRTYMVPAALEWAADPNGDGDLSDHLDVVNLSIGSSRGLGHHVDAMAADNAALTGMIVVASAGNDGDTHFVTGSPGAATRAISVAATTDSSDTLDAFTVTAPSAIAGNYTAKNSTRYTWNSGPVEGFLAYPPTQRTGCGAFTPSNAALLAGRIALLDWTEEDCGSGQRTNNAAAAGAIGVLFVNPSRSIDVSISGSSAIPSAITAAPTGDVLKTSLVSSDVRVKLTNEFDNASVLRDDTRVDTAASFTSRGPRSGDLRLKPDLGAPGVTMFGAKSGTGNLGISMNGTSQAAPFTTGVMALLRQFRPSWSAVALKAVVMNTATGTVWGVTTSTPPRHSPSRIGAGRINAAAAAEATVWAAADEDPAAVSVSYGHVEVTESGTTDRRIRVVNEGSVSRTFAISYDAIADAPGVDISFPEGPSITVPPGGTSTFTIRLTADRSAMRHVRESLMAEKQYGNYRYWMTEESGYATLTSPSHPTLRVPVHAAPRPATAMRSPLDFVELHGATGTLNVPLTGTPLDTGTSTPIDIAGIVSALELQYVSPPPVKRGDYDDSTRARFIGVTSDTKTVLDGGQSIDKATVFFGIAAWDDWTSPAELYATVYIDTTMDGRADYFVDSYNSEPAGKSDSFIVTACRIDGTNCTYRWLNNASPSWLDLATHNTNLLLLSANAASIGITSPAQKFRYWVVLSNGSGGRSSPALLYEPARPGVRVGGTQTATSWYYDVPGTLAFTYDRSAIQANGILGILLLHHHNGRGTREEAVIFGDPRRRGLRR